MSLCGSGRCLGKTDALLDPVQALIIAVQPAVHACQPFLYVRHTHFEVMDIGAHEVELRVNFAKETQDDAIRAVGHCFNVSTREAENKRGDPKAAPYPCLAVLAFAKHDALDGYAALGLGEQVF